MLRKLGNILGWERGTVNTDGNIFYFDATQGHSGGNRIDLCLQENVQMHNAWEKYIFHFGSTLIGNLI